MKSLEDFVVASLIEEQYGADVECTFLVVESDAAANTTTGVAAADAPQFKVSRVAGCDCIEVDPQTYMKCKFGKKPYSRWNGYVEDDGLRAFIQGHYAKAKKLMIVNTDTGAASYMLR